MGLSASHGAAVTRCCTQVGVARKATGADTLVNACPATFAALQEANQTDLAVKDIVERGWRSALAF